MGNPVPIYERPFAALQSVTFWERRLVATAFIGSGFILGIIIGWATGLGFQAAYVCTVLALAAWVFLELGSYIWRWQQRQD